MNVLIDLEKIKRRKYTEENGFKMHETDFIKRIYICGWNDAIDAVCKITPSEKKRGRWVYEGGHYCCSICGHRPYLKTCYCSTCGAEMGAE